MSRQKRTLKKRRRKKVERKRLRKGETTLYCSLSCVTLSITQDNVPLIEDAQGTRAY